LKQYTGPFFKRKDQVKYKNAESKLNLNKSELIALGHSNIEIHSFSPGIKITTDKFKLLGIIIPTNGKQEYGKL
jgi:hypothetical protein